MDLGLTTEQKLQTLRGARSAASSEIYTTLVRIGVDPDTFVSLDDIPDSLANAGEKARLQTLLASLSLIDTKIDVLSA